jgi:saccharopine dehydrogenase (NAD+, L-lysine-forming)
LLDLEFLVDERGRRVAVSILSSFPSWFRHVVLGHNANCNLQAFGFHAGFAGAALALEVWAWQQNHSEPFPGVSSYPNEDALIANVKAAVESGTKKAGRVPQVIVIGALGRCGSGAVAALQKAGIPEDKILKWDMAETVKGGPFEEITESDIFVNCIYLTSKIPNFGKGPQISLKLCGKTVG